jgi:hypothetical protein
MSDTPRLINQLAKLPLRAFVFSLEMFVQTAQGLQRLAYQGIDSMLGAEAQPDVAAPAGIDSLTNWVTPCGLTRTDHEATGGGGGAAVVNPGVPTSDDAADGAATNLKERVHMRDANLNDDMLKLVRYKILFVKRDYEVAFPEEEDLVPDNMTGADFSAWKVAEFIQRLGHRPPDVRFPKRWATKSCYDKYGLPRNWDEAEALQARARKAVEEAEAAHREAREAKDKNKPDAEVRQHQAEEAARRANEAARRAEPYWLTGFPEDDKKYLRVFYEVLERYPREKLRYEERQLEILERIADNL